VKLFASTLIVVLFVCRISSACSCQNPTIAVALQSADVVFIGSVTDVRLVGTPSESSSAAQRTIVTLSVLNHFKDIGGRTIVLHTSYGGNGCGGFYFERGKIYLVFANHRTAVGWVTRKDTRRLGVPKSTDRIIEVATCSRTKQVREEYTDEDLQAVERLSK
jgi:hypothetical protein